MEPSCVSRCRRLLSGARILAFTFLLSLVSSLPPALAEGAGSQGAPETGLRLQEGWHVVRPGDTLEKISRKYLGAPIRWPENWELNPEVSDPNRIYPGQRLRILLPGSLPDDGALVFRISRKVENQLLPLSWQDARLNDLLQSRDSLRTFDKSSAELWFFDDTHLVLSESSLVVIGNQRADSRAELPTQIEIKLGQADLSGSLPDPAEDSIEIVLGDAVAQPRAGASGEVETRARRPEAGGAQLMVYQGESDLEAAGARVEVAEGMGSVVSEGEPPGPPEKLLPAAEGLVPKDGAVVAERRPELRWDAVDGAVSYTLEVCLDPRCGQLEARRTGLEETRWQSDVDLPLGNLLWRVTAVSRSGLDGFPTASTRLEITDRPRDEQPPRITWKITGPQARIGDTLVVGPGFEVEVEVDDPSGVGSWSPIVDGEPVSPQSLATDLAAGKHTLAIRAVDKAGNEGTSETVTFTFDPDPPVLHWGFERVGRKGQDLASQFAEDGPQANLQGRHRLQVARKKWRLDSDFTQVVVRSAKRKIRLRDLPDSKITREQGLWVLADDPPCAGQLQIAYELEERRHPDVRRPAPVLVVDATDCVGNRSRIAWPLLLGRR